MQMTNDRFATDLALRCVLHGRKIRLICNGPLVEGRAEAPNDVIVRINSGGANERTDLRYTAASLPPVPQLGKIACVVCELAPFAPDWAAACAARNIPVLGIVPRIRRLANVLGPSHSWVDQLCRELNTLPLTGVLALYHLSLMTVESIYVEGMTFWESDLVIPHRRDTHFIAPQVEFCQRLCKRDLRISGDKNFVRIMRGETQFEEVERWTEDNVTFIRRKRDGSVAPAENPVVQQSSRPMTDGATLTDRPARTDSPRCDTATNFTGQDNG